MGLIGVMHLRPRYPERSPVVTCDGSPPTLTALGQVVR
jgi:hypothetical protein